MKYSRLRMRASAMVFWLPSMLLVQSCGDDRGVHSVNQQQAPPPATLLSHALVFQRMRTGRSEITLPPLSRTSPSGLILIGVGRGDASAMVAPEDLAAGTATRIIGESHAYTKYPQSAAALYSHVSAAGGPAPIIGTRMPPGDEVTLAAVSLSRNHVQDVSWSEARPGRIFSRYTVKSGPVRTSGPATLVAFWWGDAGVRDVKTATPGEGFRRIDSVLEAGELVQCAVAIKEVAAAGTYTVSWTASPRQSAQLWLVAVQ